MSVHPWADPAAEPDLLLTFDQPEKWPTANDRMHHMPRARLTRYWRDLAHVKARAAARGRTFNRAHIVVTLHWPDKRLRDTANWHPLAKACVDGIVADAGLLPGDDWRHVVGPDLRHGEPGPKRFTVAIFDLGSAS